MFTGLIEDLGEVRALRQQGGSTRICLATHLPMEEIALGDSIAVNGVCLTVVEWGGGTFSADVSPETLQRSNLGLLRAGSAVNLERALRLSDRLGGHLVSGHIDACAVVRQRATDGNAIRFSFDLDAAALRYVVEKGSVAIDGISLTVNQVTNDGFSVAVIPHSLAKTTLQHYGVGSRVNVETDLIGRYVEKLIGRGTQTGGLTLETLARNGFV
ncbi:MAG: riboflavin synthase [Desulfuromonadaceae bacterium]|nr:riboflavin synthase [Desulfuromonadaceae bacterium]